MPEHDDRLAAAAAGPRRGIARRPAGRLAWWLAAAAAITAMVTAAGAIPVGAAARPYWVGNFRDGTYCQFVTVFESTSVNAGMSSQGDLPACEYTRFARDPGQRVHLSRRPAPPRHAGSPWVSHQELRITDGPWFSGYWSDKATIRLTTEQTMNGPFRMGAVRWFRFSFYLPKPGFNWPVASWYDLMDLHNSVKDPAGHDWPTIEMVVTPTSGDARYVALALDGVRARANYEEVRLLRLSRARGPRAGTRVARAFNLWHTVILGVKFSDQGAVGRSPGWVRAYFDGRLLYRKRRPNVWAGEAGPYMTLQNYKRHTASFVGGARSSTIYFADARIGTTLAAVSR